jgi:hypothetical protein
LSGGPSARSPGSGSSGFDDSDDGALLETQRVAGLTERAPLIQTVKGSTHRC